MYNETYDDYIRSILGYPPVNAYNDYQNYRNQNTNYIKADTTEIEKCYPEIYKIVYPMITTKCSNIRENVTSKDIENMTDEIYYALEEKNDVRLNSNLTNEVKETTVEKRETRQINMGLRDLIKILLIRELLNRPSRPPVIRPPMKPPFRPGAGRMPFNNREFNFSEDMFEI